MQLLLNAVFDMCMLQLPIRVHQVHCWSLVAWCSS